ncbi:MAG: cell envelope integrity protein TolA [Candidatus Ornithomonoglobus sp.]
MRECIYCGKQLEKGEVCTCAMSVARRKEKEARSAAEKAAEPKTKKEEKAEAREKQRQTKEREKNAKRNERQRRAEEKRANRSAYNAYKKNSFANVWRLFKDFVKSPVETVLNPGDMTKAEILLFAIIEGIIGGLCVYSVVTGASRGPLRLLGNLLGFKGVAGYGVLLGWIASALSGAIGGVLIFFIYSGVFYLVSKWIFKMFTPYWEFVKRFAFVAIPAAIIGAVGVILGIFSQTTFAVLLLCGVVGTIVLTYEILRSMWYSKSPAKTLYTMMLCIFIFLLIVLYIVRLSVL